MTDLRKAAETALEALETLDCGDTYKTHNAASALRQALAQPEHEPVAWINYNAATGEETINRDCHSELASTPLYKTPLQNEITCVCGAVWDGELMTIPPRENKQKPVAWDGACVLGHCDSPAGCEESNCCRANCTTPDVDAVNMSQERVDETAKREHEPFIYVREDNEKPFGGYEHCSEADTGAFPVYTAPPKREWVGLTDDEMQEAGRYSYCRGGTSEKLYHLMWNSQPSASVGWCRAELIAFAQTIEAKLKEKNT